MLQALAECIYDGVLKSDSNPKLAVYKGVFEELSVVNEMVLRGSRIVVPESLQCRMVKLAHDGHQGLVKSKRLLRAKVWFPGMDKVMGKEVKVCLPCQASVVTPVQEPLQSTELPKGP